MRQWIWLVLLIGLTGCGGAGASKIAPAHEWADQQTTTAPAQGAADGTNSLTFELLKSLPLRDGENIFLSPLSLATCFGLFAQGTEGKAETAVLDLLHSKTTEGLAESQKSLLVQCLKSPAHDFNVANSVWSADLPFRQTFADQVSRFYGASVNAVPRSDLPAKMNDWVKHHTRGRIPQLFDSINPLEFLFYVNAVTFDGLWQIPFDKGKTDESYTFTKSQGEKVRVAMMTDGGSFKRFGDYESLSMMGVFKDSAYGIVLHQPAKGSPLQFLKGLNAKKWHEMMKPHTEASEISLPRFKFTTSYEMQDAFMQTRPGMFASAEKSKVLTVKAEGRLARIIHKAFIEVDESGVKAAAATGMTEAAKSIEMPAVFDHPFALIIYHVPTKAIAFVGVVADPSKSD